MAVQESDLDKRIASGLRCWVQLWPLGYIAEKHRRDTAMELRVGLHVAIRLELRVIFANGPALHRFGS